jgi:ABC-type multidrug transport system ATPase subunit
VRSAVEAGGLVKEYGGLRAVDGISFHIDTGECFGFLGPNGAGKTTTMRMLYGRLRRTAGRLTVLGFDPSSAARSSG